MEAKCANNQQIFFKVGHCHCNGAAEMESEKIKHGMITSECAFLKAQDWDWCNMLNINAMNRCRMANEMKQGSSVMWHNQLWLERENVPSYFSLESRYWRWSLFWSNVVIYVIRLLIAYSHPANHPKWSQQPKFPGQSRTNSTDN